MHALRLLRLISCVILTANGSTNLENESERRLFTFTILDPNTTTSFPVSDATDAPTLIEEEEGSAHQIFTNGQVKILSFLHYLTAPLSAFGSSVIIHSLLTNQRRNLRPPARRLMLGVSVNDLLTSFAWVFLSPWASPKDAQNYVAGAHGNFATCSVMGFFINFQIGASYYSAFLSLFFLLQVRFEMRSETFTKWLEPLFHTVGIFLPLVSGAYAAANEMMNPLVAVPGACWLADYPASCSSPDNDLECTRAAGNAANFQLLALVLGTGTFGICLILILTSMVFLVARVLQLERKMQQYTVTGETAAVSLADLTRTKAVGVEAILYIVAYLLSFFPGVLLQVYKSQAAGPELQSYFFASGVIFKIFNPLQGFLNLLIMLKRSGANATVRANVSRVRDSFQVSAEASRQFVIAMISGKSECSSAIPSNCSVISEEDEDDMSTQSFR